MRKPKRLPLPTLVPGLPQGDPVNLWISEWQVDRDALEAAEAEVEQQRERIEELERENEAYRRWYSYKEGGSWTLQLSRYHRDNLLALMCAVERWANSGDWFHEVKSALEPGPEPKPNPLDRLAAALKSKPREDA